MLKRRHLIVDIAPEQRAELLDSVLAETFPSDEHARNRVFAYFLNHNVPGIVCRPTLHNPDDKTQLGLSFPFRQGHARVRSTVLVREKDLVRCLDPYQVMALEKDLDWALSPCMEHIRRTASKYSLEVGVVGSVALEIVTHAPYVEENSDVDLVIRHGAVTTMAAFKAEIDAHLHPYMRRSDVEVEAGELGLKLDELLSDSATLLAKTIHDVRIVDRGMNKVDLV